MFRQGFFIRHSNDWQIVASATGAGGSVIAQGFIGPCPLGYVWYLENWTTHLPTHTAVLELAISPSPLPSTSAAWDRTGRQWWSGTAAADFAPLPPSALFVPEGYYINAMWTGGTLAASDTAILTTQIAVHQLNPLVVSSPEDRFQVQEVHQRPEREHAETSHSYATGELAV